jgi:hypothetical protein
VMQVDIRSNSILANGGLGIDLGAPGVLANDPGDGDVGANGLQNYPLLSAVGGSPGTLRVTLNSQPGTYVVQVFGNDTCDPSGHGEGQQLVKETTLTITGETAVVDLPDGIVPGLELTATANTSEFSPCVAFTQQELLVSQNLGAGAYSASQTAGGSSPSFAFDGNLVNNWNAGWWPLQWIEVDLQQARALGRIRLHVEQSPAGETTHEVWISNNPIGASLGGATLAHVFTGPTASGQVLEVVWDPTETARYVQVRTTVSPSWVAWREVQIFAIVNTP